VGGLKRFTTGVSGLDSLMGEITPPYTVMIAGHPGAGKTTLAETICYNNAVNGLKCLYISLYEDKEKHYRYMERLGLRLSEVEARGLYKYVKLPLTLEVDFLVNEISKLISKGYDIIVVDSISALLEPVLNNPEKRAWLTKLLLSNTATYK